MIVAQHSYEKPPTDTLTEPPSVDPCTGLPTCLMDLGDPSQLLTDTNPIQVDTEYVLENWTAYSLGAEAFLDSYLLKLSGDSRSIMNTASEVQCCPFDEEIDLSLFKFNDLGRNIPLHMQLRVGTDQYTTQ